MLDEQYKHSEITEKVIAAAYNQKKGLLIIFIISGICVICV